jgi:hypothetical protein
MLEISVSDNRDFCPLKECMALDGVRIIFESFILQVLIWYLTSNN